MFHEVNKNTLSWVWGGQPLPPNTRAILADTKFGSKTHGVLLQYATNGVYVLGCRGVIKSIDKKVAEEMIKKFEHQEER